jgi:hypothetical protein
MAHDVVGRHRQSKGLLAAQKEFHVVLNLKIGAAFVVRIRSYSRF